MMRWSAQRTLRIAAALIRAPFVVTDWLTRAIVYLVGTYILLTRDTLPCPGCRADVPLHGWYRCEICGGTFLGSAFAPCPTPGCGSITPYIPCPRCGHGVWNPTWVGGKRR
jgi:hypothetical protein